MKGKSIKEIMSSSVSNYTGSETTRALVEAQIIERWGPTEVKNYDPLYNARTFSSWLSLGYRVKKGEKALKSITYVEGKDEEGNITRRMRRPCNIFYYRQVQEINPKESI